MCLSIVSRKICSVILSSTEVKLTALEGTKVKGSRAEVCSEGPFLKPGFSKLFLWSN